MRACGHMLACALGDVVDVVWQAGGGRSSICRVEITSVLIALKEHRAAIAVQRLRRSVAHAIGDKILERCSIRPALLLIGAVKRPVNDGLLIIVPSMLQSQPVAGLHQKQAASCTMRCKGLHRLVASKKVVHSSRPGGALLKWCCCAHLVDRYQLDVIQVEALGAAVLSNAIHCGISSEIKAPAQHLPVSCALRWQARVCGHAMFWPASCTHRQGNQEGWGARRQRCAASMAAEGAAQAGCVILRCARPRTVLL